MDLRQLRYFVTIVQSGSISRAAARLRIAQPALSLHVRNMEASLGVALLFRTAQGVRPTQAGAILLSNARQIIDQFDATCRMIKGDLGEPGGEVRLGLPGTIGQTLGVPLVAAVRQHFPKVRLSLAQAASGYVLDWLRQGSVDLGLLHHGVTTAALQSTAVVTDALLLIGPAAPLDGFSPPAHVPVSFATLAGLSLILPTPGNGLRDLLDDEARAQGLRLDPEIAIDASGTIKMLVEKRFGYSILPANAVRQESDDGRLRAWPIDPVVSRTVHLVEPSNRPSSAAIAAVRALCCETLVDLVETGAWHAGRLSSGRPALRPS